MPTVVIKGLPVAQQPPRDPNFTYAPEAKMVGDSLAKAPEIVAHVGTIVVQETLPIVPNTRDDGRSVYFVQFNMPMDLPNELNVMQLQTVEFNMNAGLLLDFAALEQYVDAPWKFNATREQRPNSAEMFWMGVAKK